MNFKISRHLDNTFYFTFFRIKFKKTIEAMTNLLREMILL